jgi:pantothenate kinase/uncharacterized protein YndB with AHSA1/START domain
MTTTRVTRHVRAPRARVYRALLDADEVARWRVPAAMTCVVHELDAREGGSVRVSLTYSGGAGEGKTSEHTDTYRGRFERLVPDELVVEVDEFETDDASMAGPMRSTITLADADGGTRLTAVHEGLPPGVPPADNETGWNEALDRLARLVETAWTPTLAELVERVVALADRQERVVVGLTGPPGAGKTTLVECLVEGLRAHPEAGGDPGWVRHVPMDGFHLADVELERLGLRQRKGAPATFDAGGYVAALRRIRAREQVVYVPAFERELEQPLAGAIPVPATARVVLTEGNYLLCGDGGWESVRPLLDEVWYVDADEPVRLARLVARHVRFGKAPRHAEDWVLGSDEPNARLVALTRDRADLVVTAG